VGDTTLIGGEETVVEGYFDGEKPENGPVLLEPESDGLVGLGLMLPRALVEAGQRHVVFTMINMGKTLSLLPGTPVAMMAAVGEITGLAFSRDCDSPPGVKAEDKAGGQGTGYAGPEQSLPVTAASHKEESVAESAGAGMKDENPLPEHLQALYDQAISELDEAQAKGVKSFLCKEQDMFVGPGTGLGRTHLVKHGIDTGNSPPFKIGPRRQGPYLKKIIDDEVEDMLKEGIAKPSCSPWSSPVVLSKKKDGTYRFCVDYRNLNSLTRKDSYPLPCIADCIDSLSGARWYSTLDLASGYWQVEMEASSKPKTAFATHQGLFEFNVMPFGLTNAPATFERIMEMTLRGLQWQECLIFLDDIIVFGTSFEEAKGRLQNVFARFREAGLRLKPSKCSLFQKEVSFLGHVVSEQGVACDPKKVRAVSEWPRPKNLTEVRSFLGLCSYYRRFVKGFAAIASPLHSLTEKGRKFEWDRECQEAFEVLKGALIGSSILAYPEAHSPHI
jgi:hypothetical protein